MSRKKEKKTLHPIMSYLILIGIVIIASGILNLLDFENITYSINNTTLEYTRTLVSVENLFSLEGLKYIFSNTVSNFMNFAPLSNLIIVLIGFGVMEKSGFLKTAIEALTKKLKKNIVTFVIILLSIIASVMGEISYIILLPLSALIFKYGKRNPMIGIVASFAGLTCGQGLSVIFTSVDSSLLSLSLVSARVIDTGYRMASISGVFIMAVATILLAYVLTSITERVIAQKFGKYTTEEEIEEVVSQKELEQKGLKMAGIAALAFIIVFLYNIIPGLPLSGNLLDNSQILYVDKLFSYNSFFSSGFVFIVTLFFIILGLFYGIGAKTIKNHQDFVDTLGHSLDGIGKTLVLIFFASLFISLFKKSNIGTVIIAYLGVFFQNISFTGLPLIILLFIVSGISSLFLGLQSVSKWAILSPVVIPVFMNAGMTPEFAQIIYRFGENVTMGLTPIMAYFVIYLAVLNKYQNKEKSISITEAIKFQVSYQVVTFLVLLGILIIWYIIGLPLGINGVTVL